MRSSVTVAAALLVALASASNARVTAQSAAAPPPSPEAAARQVDASDLAEGRRLFEQKGNCQACHGWSGDGHKTDNQMPDGANLRETKIPRAGLVMTIKCGRLNSQMPAFDKFAYSDGRCYGKTQADLKAYPTRMPDPPATLQAREIELIVDFMTARIVGKGPMDHAKCVEFWGGDEDICRDLK
ncbi:MAG TPA: cytochrome c [Vicinamibacterales bacterium]|jgi:mono/diheme cytochrome c family protein|nr:cytochrome c [Vicinamibacterales bacterium]